MDALFTIVGTTALLIVFAALSVLFGTDTRDGFTDRPIRPTFR
ncbi:MAG TPA: hypothetical protein VFJ71_10270 [Candidatus Limnocylindrales bacterium]|nr:hypothetical protein [Candidatus Limnocylindrales bacterium]